MAWLELVGSGLAAQTSPVFNTLNYLTTLGPTQVTVTPAGGQPIPARIGGHGTSSDESGTGLFAGTYYFEVPANLTAATLTITPGSVQAESSYLGSPETVAVQGNAAFPLTFPAPYVPPPPPVSAPAAPGPHTTGATSGARAGSRRPCRSSPA